MSTFLALDLHPTLCATVERLGYSTPTRIQAEAIPLALAGRDIIARAPTGTGKTAAFGLPLVQRLAASRAGQSRAPRALVLVPTRELAEQVARSLSSFVTGQRLRVAAIYGGTHMGAQIQALRRGVDIVVATPGRLMDHVQRRTVDLGAIEELTLDEADRMLDMGFLPALKQVLTLVPAARRTQLFSATLPDAVQKLSLAFTRDAARVDVAPALTAALVTHEAHPAALDQKRAMLTHLLAGAGDRALVFCTTKRASDRVGDHLERQGLGVAVIHGDKSQGQRSRALRAFTNGQLQVLVATDVAGRGLDIADVGLVINFDLPLAPEDYVHRVGRTGRAGRSGRAVSLVSQADGGKLRRIQHLLRAPIVTSPLAGFVAAAPSQRPAPERRPGARVEVGGHTRPPFGLRRLDERGGEGPGRYAAGDRRKPARPEHGRTRRPDAPRRLQGVGQNDR